MEGHTPEDWRETCDAAIRELARTRGPFSAIDVRAIVGDPPNHYNAMGARFLAAARAGLIVRVGYVVSDRPTLHAHPIAQWVGVDA